MTTKETTTAKKVNHPWSADALLAKAQRYAEDMLSHSPEDWQFGLVSTFVLEFLARAALANISPTLLADPNNSNNFYFALGRTSTAPKFIPRSIDVTMVLTRLREVIPDEFTPEQHGFAAQHFSRRNEELHTGSTLDSTPTAYQQIANPINSEGFTTNAEVNLKTSPPSMTLYKGFFGQTFLLSQSQIVLHEAVHLVTYFGDRELATAATGKVYANTTRDNSEASEDWHNQLKKNCH
jgi:hypothetical protein